MKLMEVKGNEEEKRLIEETLSSLEEQLTKRDPLFSQEGMTRIEKSMVRATLQFLVQDHRNTFPSE